jgi:hypothetical protein
MTREEILKELELWPLWKLKAMVPDMSAEAVEERKPAAETEPEPQTPVQAEVNDAPIERVAVVAEEEAVAPDMPEYRAPESTMVDASIPQEAAPIIENMRLQVFASDDGQCLLVHHGESPSQDEIQIRNNITRAMRLNTKLLADVVSANQLLENHSPKVLVLFGEQVAQSVLAVDETLEDMRGIELDFNEHACIATFDMPHLIANVQDKRKAWQDLCMALALLAIE